MHMPTLNPCLCYFVVKVAVLCVLYAWCISKTMQDWVTMKHGGSMCDDFLFFGLEWPHWLINEIN